MTAWLSASDLSTWNTVSDTFPEFMKIWAITEENKNGYDKFVSRVGLT